MTLQCHGDFSCNRLTILCPKNQICNVSCIGHFACENLNIISYENTKLLIEASGGLVLHNAYIECSAAANSEESFCDLYVFGDGFDNQMMNDMIIYSESVFYGNGLHILCDNKGTSCFSTYQPKLLCSEDIDSFLSFCEIGPNKDGSNWECKGPQQSKCLSYKHLTDKPSPSPTFESYAYDHPQTLYVSKANGSDDNICDCSMNAMCRTMDSAYFCLNDQYDGNGKIKLMNGEYTFNQSIDIRHDQVIVVEGRGINETVLNASFELPQTTAPTQSFLMPTCIEVEESHSLLNGQYIFFDYDDNLAAPIYYNSNMELYLYPYSITDGNAYWILGPAPGSIQAYAFAPTSDYNDIFESNGQWMVTSSGQWVDEPDMMITACS